MALHWHLADIKNYETLCWTVAEHDIRFGPKKGEKVLSPVTEALINATLAVGIRTIKLTNWHRFFMRVAAYERLVHALRAGNNGPVYFTPEEVKAHIGLWTNATGMTATEFEKRLKKNI